MFLRPKYPIVVIGAGIAGMAAAVALQDQGWSVIVFERFDRPGGRLNSRVGDGWIADHGTPFFMRSHKTVCDLVRHVGMEDHRVSIQGAVHRLQSDGSIVVPKGGGYDPNRLCLDVGFSEMMRRLAKFSNVRYETGVRAIHWHFEERSFMNPMEGFHIWFEGEDGAPITDPTTRETVRAGGVVLATTATAAEQIARNSKCIDNLAPVLASVKYESAFVGMYKVPRFEARWFALEGTPESRIAWLGLEDRKAPERVDEDYSLLVVHASTPWSGELMKDKDRDALHALWEETRRILPSLPEKPISQTWKKWHVSRLAGEPLGVPAPENGKAGRWPTRPRDLPFALAGDYLLGPSVEDSARSGVEAARMMVAQLPKKMKNPLLKFHIGQ